MTSSADTLSAWVSGDKEEVARGAERSGRFQRHLFNSLTYSVSPDKFATIDRATENYRAFESAHVWVFRGKKNMQEDLQKFMHDVSQGLVGYLQAATGLGKSTKIVRDIAAKISGKIFVISPEERLVSLTWKHVRGVEMQTGGNVEISRLTGLRRTSSLSGQLIYMTATTLLVSMLCSESFLDENEAEIIYVDEAHCMSAEYDMIRCLSMLKFFGDRTVVFSSATPPGLSSQEAFRDVEPAIDSFDYVDTNLPVHETAGDRPYHFSAVSGRVLVFAVDDDHAVRLHQYYLHNDIDAILVNTNARTADWRLLLDKFLSNPGTTSVVVTSFVLETGYNFHFGTVIDFSMRPTMVYNVDKKAFSMSIRPIPSSLAHQRAGRAGRMGGTCRVFRMDVPPMNSRNPICAIVSEVQSFCWMQLFNVSSQRPEFARTAQLVGQLSLTKLRLLLSSALHPVLLLCYMDEHGYVMRPFVNSLKVYFPAGFDFGDTIDVSYGEATCNFQTYRNSKTSRKAKIPLSQDNYFLGDMLYIDQIAVDSVVVDNDGMSFAGDAVLNDDDLNPKVKEKFKVQMLRDVVNRKEKADSVMGARHSLEGLAAGSDRQLVPDGKMVSNQDSRISFESYPALRNRDKNGMIAAVRDFNDVSPVIPEADLKWDEYDALNYSQVRWAKPGVVPAIPRQTYSIAPSMSIAPSVRPSREVVAAGDAVRSRRERGVSRDLTRVPRVHVPVVRNAVNYPSKASVAETIWPMGRPEDVDERVREERQPVRGLDRPREHELKWMPLPKPDRSGDFHAAYGLEPPKQEPILPKMTPRPAFLTFLQVGQPVNAEDHADEMLFPYKDVVAKKENYVKPSDSDLELVTEFVMGRSRISGLNNRERDAVFVALLKTWNANVVDAVQYQGNKQHIRKYSETYSSRTSGGNRKREIKVYKGTRFTTEELLVVFSALQLFGLIPCITMLLEPHGGGEVGFSGRNNVRMQQLLSSKDIAVYYDKVSIDRSLKKIGMTDLIDACEIFLGGSAWEYTLTRVCPNVFAITKLGYVLGAGLNFGGKFWTLGHILGRSLRNCDLVSHGVSRTAKGPEPEKSEVILGEYCFVIVANPGCVSGLKVKCGESFVDIHGPLRIVGATTGGFIACEGDSMKGMSGSTVVSANSGKVIGLLYGIDQVTRRVLVTRI